MRWSETTTWIGSVASSASASAAELAVKTRTDSARNSRASDFKMFTSSSTKSTPGFSIASAA